MTTATDWTGRTGDVWAAEWQRTDRAFAGIAAVLDARAAAIAPRTGRALDIGCGAGATTLALARARPKLHLLGIDLSVPLVLAASDRLAQPSNVTFVSGDVAEITGGDPFDLIVSRHGVMFFDDPVAAFARLHAATRPGARLLFTCFRARERNDWAAAIDGVIGATPAPAGYAPGPFSLAHAGFTADVLRDAGWRQAARTSHDVPYLVGAGADPVADALAFFRRIGQAAPALAAASPAERRRIEQGLRRMLEGHLHDGAVSFTAAISLWEAVA